MLTLDGAIPFNAAAAEAFLASLPPRPAVVLIEPRAELAGARPLLLRTADLRRRLRLLLGPRDPDPATAKRVHLAGYAGGIRFRLTGSAFEQSLAHYQNARALWPREYRKRMRLRSPALIKLSQASAYPRAYVTRRAAAGGVCFGPFASRRAADTFLESFLDLFHLRRCQIKILRDPSFPGCIYSEMKKCLAPCFAGCTDEEYAAESSRAAAFLDTGGSSAITALEREREAASTNLEFERAALLHRDLEKAETARRGIPEIARTIQTLDAVILQRGAEDGAIAVFVVKTARIADPFLLRFTELAGRPRSVEEILRAALDPSSNENAARQGMTPPNSPSSAELEDHLALLARWFYARPRLGEIFFPEAGPHGWPYRRMLRACSRLLQRDPLPENH
jgi:excinuclease UvrABC nuclease subunit